MLLPKRVLKMAEYWGSFVFSRSINTQKKNETILTEQAWSIEDLLYGKNP